MNFHSLLLLPFICLFPFFSLANNQDSLAIFKEKKLSEQHLFIKERLNSAKDIQLYITVFSNNATAQKDTLHIAKSYYFKYRFFRKVKVYAKAHTAIDKAILLAKHSKKDSLLGSFFHAKGATFFIQSNYKDALAYYLKAYDVMRIKGSVANRLALEFDIATIKLRVRKTEEALAEFDKIIHSYDSLLTAKSNSRFLRIRFIKILNNTAKSYTKEAMYEKAIALYTKSLLLNETTNYLSGKCIAIGGKGNVYTFEKKYEKALEKLNNALEISTVNSELHLITPFLLLDKGKCLFGQKKYAEALKVFAETDSIIQAKQLNFLDLDETYRFFAKTHVQLGNHEKATAIYDQYIERKNLNADKRFELYQTIFKGYDLKNVEHRAEEATKASNLFKSYFSKAILVITVLVIATIIFFLYDRNRQKKKFAKFHALIAELKAKEVNVTEIQPKGYVLSDEKATKILHNLETLEAKLFFLDKKYNLSTLAKKCNTNSSYLSKVINQYKEKTFSEYMIDMRITYVLNALKNDKKLRSYTIQSIAEEIGFKKSESFAKAFKKRTGFNPSYYIKSLEKL
ncbi:MAG: helix-turn-helix domain-containing protein [Kordia sp.]|uniref:helix-turn-helix domain-containing protein n=1 Tax=Kordia sp. TaxID=1965332 RepID=UPI00385B0890